MQDESHLERLLAELGDRAAAELAQVRSDAERHASRLIADAEARVSRRRDDAIAACETDYARRRAAAAADATRAARGALLRAQHALVDAAVQRARGMVLERLAREGDTPALVARRAELMSFASDATIATANGLVLTANAGHLVIDDSVDAWLAGARDEIAIDVCRAVEAA